MTRILLTGATGVIGRRTIPRLVAAGHRVTAVARTAAKASQVTAAGATPIEVDLFDADAVRAAVDGHDVVAHLATHIPTGASAATKRGWAANDRLRVEAANNLAQAAIDVGVGRYVQESITFPYADGGDDWIDESYDRTYFWGNRTTVDAEAAADSVTRAGATGVVLRFAMFMAPDSGHMRTFAKMARRGIWGLFGADEAFVSFVHADDAATAVVAALDAPAGVYNIAEDDPQRRAAHRAALASAAGRPSLRSLPRVVAAAGGEGVESLARSQRISSDAYRAATGWAPVNRPIDVWKELA